MNTNKISIMKSIRKLFEASHSTVSATLAVSPAEFRYFTSPSILQVRVLDNHNDTEEAQVQMTFFHSQLHCSAVSFACKYYLT